MKTYNVGGGDKETTKAILEILRMSTREELKIKLRDWMRAVIRTTADSAEYRSRRYSSLNDIAKDMSIAFGTQFQIKMNPKWVLRELHRVKYSGGGNL